MTTERLDNTSLTWSLIAMLPVVAWFMLTAQLAISHGADLTASANTSLRILVTTQAFLIALLGASHRHISVVDMSLAHAGPVLMGLPFAALFWMSGTLTLGPVLMAQGLLLGFAAAGVLCRWTIDRALPPSVALTVARLLFGIAACAAIFTRDIWLGWLW